MKTAGYTASRPIVASFTMRRPVRQLPGVHCASSTFTVSAKMSAGGSHTIFALCPSASDNRMLRPCTSPTQGFAAPSAPPPHDETPNATLPSGAKIGSKTPIGVAQSPALGTVAKNSWLHGVSCPPADKS